MIFVFVIVITCISLFKFKFDSAYFSIELFSKIYLLLVHIWLMGIISLTLFPVLGGRIWCRYWCPLGKLLGWISVTGNRFQISANSKCVGCQECSRYCQMGIDVMHYAQRRKPVTNKDTSCIGCGICITSCPADVLSFGKLKYPELVITDQN